MNNKISIIFPCRNEKESIKDVLIKTLAVIKKNKLPAEIIVSDSSSDGSDKIAQNLKVKVRKHNKEGYGVALTEGIKTATGKVIIYLDADGTYSPEEIPNFLKELKDNDIVIGSRFKGKIEKNAMPFLHRFLGTPLINFLLLIFFGIKTSDSQSGFRAMKKETFEKLNLKTAGMEFATEMLIKAKKEKLKIKEIPISYYPRKGTSKLRPYYDGFHHIRYIAIQIPIFFYLIPSFLLLLIGFLGLTKNMFNFKLYPFLETATVKFIFPILGVEIFFLGLFAKTFLTVKFKEISIFAKKLNQFLRAKNVILLFCLLVLLPFLLKIINATDNFFEILFASTLIGFLLLFNTFILSIINTLYKN